MSVDLENDLLILLSDVARHIRTYGDELALSLGITRAQLIILARLERQPDLSQIELAAIAEVTPMTIARLIDRLETLGMVERCPDPADRRIWRLRLTPATAPLVREINNFCAKLHRAATKGIEPAILKTMAVGLRRIKANVGSRRVSEPSLEEPPERPAEKIRRTEPTARRRSA
jgi:MarR family transcriptional regulator, transcriptional regulator for hemolysin